MALSSIDTSSEAAASKNSNAKNLNIAHCFQPIYILSRMFGFMPFSIAFDSNDAIQTARIKFYDIL